MTGAATVLNGIVALITLTSLNLSVFGLPSDDVQSGSTYTYIIVGGGTAGSILAARLTEIENVNVLVIESGDIAPYESLKNGSSPLDHSFIYARGSPADYYNWASLVGDDSWSWESLNPYFVKNTLLEDSEILNSDDAEHYGTNGFFRVSRRPDTELEPIISAMGELGFEYKLDTNGNDSLGVTYPVFYDSYTSLLDSIKNRPNLYILTNTLVTKIVIQANAAVAIEALTSDNKILTVYSGEDIIVSAGALNSPKLLMLSGVGPSSHLESLDIEVVANLTGVGQNLKDHSSVFIVHTLEESDAVAAAVDPKDFSFPLLLAYKTINPTQSYPDYEAIPILMRHDSNKILAICKNVFYMNDDICNAIYDSAVGRNILLTIHSILHPASQGEVLLRSTDPRDNPIVHVGLFSEEADLVNDAAYLADYAALVNTTYFRNLSSSIVEMPLSECSALEKYSSEWWQCYVYQMRMPLFHFSGTCAMGTVVDTEAKVIGIEGLRVVDASIIPTTISAGIRSITEVTADRIADYIKADLESKRTNTATENTNVASRVERDLTPDDYIYTQG